VDLQTVATAFVGFGILLAAASTWLQYRESRKARRLTEYQISAELTDRVWSLVPALSGFLDLPDNELETAERSALVSLLLTYAQARKAAGLGLYRDPAWDGLRDEFAFWIAQPRAASALERSRATGAGWPPGFFDFAANEVAAFRHRRPAPDAMP
jgi:hypothetical protein